MGRLKGVGDVFVDEGTAVVKIGRTTGRTAGRVTAFEIDNVTVQLDIGEGCGSFRTTVVFSCVDSSLELETSSIRGSFRAI
jgi:hypothetical protein